MLAEQLYLVPDLQCKILMLPEGLPEKELKAAATRLGFALATMAVHSVPPAGQSLLLCQMLATSSSRCRIV